MTEQQRSGSMADDEALAAAATGGADKPADMADQNPYTEDESPETPGDDVSGPDIPGTPDQ